ncbi:MAG TPA: PocR ligand-binding domain-containing protein [Candidatus Limnocylindrales bacterium]|nr:PocR ligand-binding domain-containing protein [Candidatus Limnocylindrales bacterium]
MNAFDHLEAMSGLRNMFDLAWRLFGINLALVSPDGKRVVMYEMEKRAQPFCFALEQTAAGHALCAMCDQTRFLEARRGEQVLRYRCHAGLTEFLVPVIRDGEVIALLQCGQVHDRAPSETEWRSARQSLVKAGINTGPLRKLFQKNRVLTPKRQEDLLDLLELIANRLAQADERRLRAEPGRVQAQLGRAVTFIEAHLAERLALSTIARAANVSARSLMRLFEREIGSSVVRFIMRRRVSRACDLLKHTDHTCSEIAFEAGFGSVQHFNRIFRRFEKMSPRRWRQHTRSCAPAGTQQAGSAAALSARSADCASSRQNVMDTLRDRSVEPGRRLYP